MCLAQFDDLTLPKMYTHSWLSYPLAHFQIENELPDCVVEIPKNPEAHDELKPELFNKKVSEW